MITRTKPTWHTEDWQIQLSNNISSVAELLNLLDIDTKELSAQQLAHQSFPIKVPKAFAAKMKPGDAQDPLLLQTLPQAQELLETPGFTNDPLQEEGFTPIPGLIHKYKSRVLLTTSSACAVNCRYCFRRHFPYADNRISQQQMADIVNYIETQPDINEVIFSGGDPLATNNSRFANYIEQLTKLPQINKIRIHSRFPVVIPQRIDEALLQLIDSVPLQWILVVHCNHPNELDQDFHEAMSLLRARGVHLFNQSVLLKGVNDDPATLIKLSEKLFNMGVYPYYLHLLDPVRGAAHFKVGEKHAKAIYRSLLASLPGYLVPKLVKETPEAPSKSPISL